MQTSKMELQGHLAGQVIMEPDDHNTTSLKGIWIQWDLRALKTLKNTG